MGRADTLALAALSWVVLGVGLAADDTAGMVVGSVLLAGSWAVARWLP